MPANGEERFKQLWRTAGTYARAVREREKTVAAAKTSAAAGQQAAQDWAAAEKATAAEIVRNVELEAEKAAATLQAANLNSLWNQPEPAKPAPLMAGPATPATLAQVADRARSARAAIQQAVPQLLAQRRRNRVRNVILAVVLVILLALARIRMSNPPHSGPFGDATGTWGADVEYGQSNQLILSDDGSGLVVTDAFIWQKVRATRTGDVVHLEVTEQGTYCPLPGPDDRIHMESVVGQSYELTVPPPAFTGATYLILRVNTGKRVVENDLRPARKKSDYAGDWYGTVTHDGASSSLHLILMQVSDTSFMGCGEEGEGAGKKPARVSVHLGKDAHASLTWDNYDEVVTTGSLESSGKLTTRSKDGSLVVSIQHR